MDVLIVGGGMAGLTLAFWLDRLGHHPVIVEQSPRLRDEGYGIDFFGPGYDVAEKMDMLPELGHIRSALARMTFVDATGRRRAALKYETLRQRVLDGRHLVLMRGDLERVLYSRIGRRVPERFGVSIAGF